jgi:hypothetical protein
MGIVGTLFVLWLSATTREVVAQGKELAIASVLLPRIEKKIDDMAQMLRERGR